MKIKEVIELIKAYHYHEWLGKTITDEHTRDQILFGDAEKECTGIVTAIYASIDVIQKAGELGANFIIVHESLFWNHGDHTDWLIDNETYKSKKELLEKYDITVWRNHDHIHAGVDVQGRRVDGIFYGLLHMMGWENYVQGDISFPIVLEIPEIPTKTLVKQLIDKMHLQGIKCIGNMSGNSHKIYLPYHIDGRDNDKINILDKEHIDTVIAMECIDYTLAIYVKDSAMLKQEKRILAVGHFNLEEPGMRWFAEEYLPTILPHELPIHFIGLEDMYSFIVKD